MAVRSVEVRLDAKVEKYIRDITLAGNMTDKAFSNVHATSARVRENFVQIDRSAANLGQSLRRTDSALDSFTGRLGLVTKLAVGVAPAFSGIAASAVPALSSVANLLGITTVAAGVSALAVQGVGDAAKALAKAELSGKAEDIAEAQRQLSELAPEAADFVIELNQMLPALKQVRNEAAAGLFPGASAALVELDEALPRLEQFVGEYSSVVGDMLAGGAADLTSGRWTDFVNFLEGEARPTLTTLGGVVGDVAHGLSELWMAMDPANDGVLGGLEKGADVFDKWATGLQGSDGLEEFLAYVQKTGPEVVDTALSLAEAMLAIGQAAAPLTGPVLDGIQALAGAAETIASSPLGGAIVGFAATSSIASVAKQGFASASASPVGQGISETISNVKDLASAFKDTNRVEEEAAEASAENAEEKAALADQVSEAAEKAGELTGANEEAASADKKATAETSKNTKAQQSRTQALRQSAAALGKQAAMLGGVMLASSGAAESMGLASTASMALTGAMIGGGAGAAVGGLVGLTMDVTKANKSWSESLAEVNDVIASGNIDAMTAKLEQLQAKVDDVQSVSSVGDFIGDGLAGMAESFSFTSALITGDADKWQGKLEQTSTATQELESAIAREQRTADAAAAAQLGLSDSVLRTGREAGYTATELRDLAKATDATKEAAWAAYDAQTRLGQAIDDVAAAADKGERGLDASTAEGRENRTVLSSLAAAWADTKAAMEENDAPARAIQRRFREVRQTLYDAAIEMGATKAEARRLANQLEKPMTIVIREQHREAIASAKAAIADLRRAIEGNPITQRVTIKRDGTIQRSDDVGLGVEDLLGGAPGRRGKAAGGPIYGPGTATSDSIPAMLSNGEYVIRAAAVDRYGVGFFDQLNMMMFANGGQVGRPGYAEGGPVRLRTGGDREADAVTRSMRGMRSEIAALTKVVAKERKQREELLDRRSSLSGGIRGGLDAGIWRPGNDWASGDPLSFIRANLANIDQFDKLTGRIKKKAGPTLKGGALDAILAEGDLATLQAYAGMSGADLRSYVRLYQRQQTRLNQVAGDAAGATWDPLIRQSNRELAEANRELKQIKGAVNRNGRRNSEEHDRDRREARAGAGRVSRRRGRGYL